MNPANTSAPPENGDPVGDSEEISSVNRTTIPLEQLVLAHVDFVWRSLRRFGVSPGEVDDATQQVFLIANSRRGDIRAGTERAFLAAVALRVASHARRADQRRETGRQLLIRNTLDEFALDPEHLTQQLQARALLDRVLDAMPDKYRTVFVLSELEELTIAEIASMLTLPPGTVASRIRRARVVFQEQAALLHRSVRGGGA